MKGHTMTAVFLEPAVFDMTCFDFHQEGNTNFWTIRFPYVSKIHTDRDWRNCVSFDELQTLAESDRMHADQEDSQELLGWIKKLEKSELKRRCKAENQATDIIRSVANIETVASSVASALSLSALPMQIPDTQGHSPRKRRRVASPDSAARQVMPKEALVELTSSPTTQVNQGSSRQALGDITSAGSSQANDVPPSGPRLSRFDTFHEEPQTAKSSPMPARLPSAASFQTAAAFSSPCKAARQTSNLLVSPTRSNSSSTQVPICQHAGATCALADYFILLSPCIANSPLLTEDLLPSHGVRAVFKDIPSWHASFDLHTSSSAKPLRLVLVEAKRKEPTKMFLSKLESDPPRSRNGGVIAYDWRMIEAITELEQAHKRSDGSWARQKIGTIAFANELWQRHFVGVC